MAEGESRNKIIEVHFVVKFVIHYDIPFDSDLFRRNLGSVVLTCTPDVLRGTSGKPICQIFRNTLLHLNRLFNLLTISLFLVRRHEYFYHVCLGTILRMFARR